MATTVGPDMPLSPRLVVSGHTADGIGNAHDNQQQTSSSSPRSNPPPNPPFVFPAKQAPSSAPSSYSRASGRRPKSLVGSFQVGSALTVGSDRRKSLSPALPDFSFNPGGARSPLPDIPLVPSRSPALPDFKFNPGAGFSSDLPEPEHPFLSPPQSPYMPQVPSSPRAIPTRPGGHKRGGSEFVGGQIRSGDAITVVSTSPTKSESGFASPQLKPTNPRRGHAHRRSAAISSHDLSFILKPTNPPPRGNSAPNSPAAFDRAEELSFPVAHEQAQETKEPIDEKTAIPDSAPDSCPKSEAIEEQEIKPPTRPPNRARVGFSDTLEFIPRPLSLVSSDTSSTVTARPGHSLSGSISSIISLTGSTTLEREVTITAPSPPRQSTDPRPSTAGAILERSLSPVVTDSTRSPQRRNSIPSLSASALGTPTSPDTPSPGKAPKRWSFFGLEPFTGMPSPTRTRPLSSSSSEMVSKKSNSSSDEREATSSAEHAIKADQESSQKVSGKKSNKKKKQKKVRTWAGSILTRKSKHRHVKKSSRSRAQTPPPLNMEASDSDSDVTAEASADALATTPTASLTDEITTEDPDWKPRPFTPPEDDAPYPMIDLDAALGPFNTPLPRNAEWEAAQRASGLIKRPLHSAARLAPNMNQHRRAESAPEMPPFNRAGLPRFNSNSTMADVFEEDEEDEGKPGDEQTSASSLNGDSPPKEGGAPSIDIRVTADAPRSSMERVTEPSEDAASSRAVSRKGSGLSGFSDDDRTERSTGLASEYSASSLHDEIIMEESSELKWHGPDGKYSLGGDTSGSSTPSPRRAFKGKDLVPVDVSPLHLPTPSLVPVSPYSIGHSSSFPSPRSPMPYEDGNRISTAPSSITEDNFQSLLLGEPGPEVRLSMDIPSLTSSNSTMTRESAFQHLSQAPIPGERPASFSSPFGRRGSLASIGRLISTSHGERSKLSIEVSLEAEEKKSKASKAKRLSRLMQFWRPKESSSKA